MGDRELLEMAARAAGISYTWCESWKCMARPLFSGDGWDYSATWSPLHDDGDALRLAVALRLDLQLNGDWVTAVSADVDEIVEVPVNDDDVQTATRRAIVLIAAAVARTEP
ncbi:hypothetical protein [Pseudomonas tohonis]|uniref:hypothetical protein n=1 Tax=Pseudomonas tohonis TaxID=2725477 RepID=UPI001F340A22|nr:hypothetical protein [Pseudomonas tohonis]